MGEGDLAAWKETEGNFVCCLTAFTLDKL